MQSQKLKKLLCIGVSQTGEACDGYLYASINTAKENVMRCRTCHNWLYTVDFDLLTLDAENDDDEDF